MLGIQFLIILRANIALFGDFWVLGAPQIMKIIKNATEIQQIAKQSKERTNKMCFWTPFWMLFGPKNQ